MYYVYILFSRKIQKFYIGQTQDIDNRLAEHNASESSFSKTGAPWEIVWKTKADSRSEAMQLELKIKKRGAKRFLNDMKISE